MKRCGKKFMALLLVLCMVMPILQDAADFARAEDVELFGEFVEESITICLGDIVCLEGEVESSGSPLNRVTYQIEGWAGDDDNNRYCSQPVSGVYYVDLAEMKDLKLDTTTAPLNQPGTYKLTVVASTEAGVWSKLDSLDVVVEEAVPAAVLSGYFEEDSISLTLGELTTVEGMAASENYDLVQVTYQIDGWYGTDDNQRYCTQAVSGVDYVNLADMRDLVLNTNAAPLNQPGSYTLKLVARAEDGTWKRLDQMTVNVQAAEEPEYAPEPELGSPEFSEPPQEEIIFGAVPSNDEDPFQRGPEQGEPENNSRPNAPAHSEEESLPPVINIFGDEPGAPELGGPEFSEPPQVEIMPEAVPSNDENPFQRDPEQGEPENNDRPDASVPSEEEPSIPADYPKAVLSGSFLEESIDLVLGEITTVEGMAASENYNLVQITYQIDGWYGTDDNQRYCTQAVSGVNYVNLADLQDLVLNTTAAPLNQPGSYTLKLVARAEDGTWNHLDEMIVNVLAGDEPDYSPEPELGESENSDRPNAPAHSEEEDLPIVVLPFADATAAPEIGGVEIDEPSEGEAQPSTDEDIFERGPEQGEPENSDQPDGPAHEEEVSLPVVEPPFAGATEAPELGQPNNNDRPAYENTSQPKAALQGYFQADSITLMVGDVVRVSGRVGCVNAFLAQVTYQIDGWYGTDDNQRYCTQAVSGVNQVSLASMENLVLNTNTAPLNQPGSYTLKLVARADDGSWDHLDEMTVNVRIPCDHTEQLGKMISYKLVQISEESPTHYRIEKYPVYCACGQINTTREIKVEQAHNFGYYSGVQGEHEPGKGHQYFEKCECGNAHTISGKYQSYLKGCSTCLNLYGNDPLYKNNRYNVRTLQMQGKLKEMKYLNDKCDGIFGTKTEEAVKAFQIANGLADSGVVDNATWQMIMDATIEVEDVVMEPVIEKCDVYPSGHRYEVSMIDTHPHAVLSCECGKTQPSNGVVNVACCECGYHEWSCPKLIGGGNYEEICMRNCGKARSVIAPASQVMVDEFIENYVDDRKEMSYVSDKSNINKAPESDLSNYYFVIRRNGSWMILGAVTDSCSNIVELHDRWNSLKETYRTFYNAEDIGITYIGVVGFEIYPSIDGSLNWSYAGDVSIRDVESIDDDEVLDIEDISRIAAEYKADYAKWRESYTGNSSVWLSVAYGATDKLMDTTYVFTNETLNTVSDPVGSIGGVFTEESWEEQKVDLWEDVLTDMLVDSYKPITSIEDRRRAFNAVGTIIDISGIGADVVPVLKEVSNKMGMEGYIHWEDLDSVNIERWDWNTFDVAFTVIDSCFAASEAAEKVKAEQDALTKMILEDTNAIQRLNNIISVTNNPQLHEAARGMIKDIEKETKKNIDNYWGKVCLALEKGLDDIKASSAPIGAGFTVLGTKIANHYLEAAALPALSVISKVASIGKGFLNWGPSYESAQTLQTYSVMEAEFDAISAMNNCGSADETNDVAQLWYSLQINGSEAAKKFAKDYSSGTGLAISDIGLTTENSLVVSTDKLGSVLDQQIQEYKKEAFELNASIK